MVPTQMPTPVRNSRPPLLATPPGFPSQLMQGGITKSRSVTGETFDNVIFISNNNNTIQYNRQTVSSSKKNPSC